MYAEGFGALLYDARKFSVSVKKRTVPDVFVSNEDSRVGLYIRPTLVLCSSGENQDVSQRKNFLKTRHTNTRFKRSEQKPAASTANRSTTTKTFQDGHGSFERPQIYDSR